MIYIILCVSHSLFSSVTCVFVYCCKGGESCFCWSLCLDLVLSSSKIYRRSHRLLFFIPPVHQIERVISSNGLCQCNMNIKLYYKYNAMHINRCFYLFLFSCSILLVSFCDCFKLFRHIFHFSAIQFICTLNGN